MPSNFEKLGEALRDATYRAFAAVRHAHPREHFYYFALVTTADALRPAPSASSTEGLERVLQNYRLEGKNCSMTELRWSEADSPHNLYGDEFFSEIDRLFLQAGEHRKLPPADYDAEVEIRFAAMEWAMLELDRSGFFGTGENRHKVVINIVTPGEESEDSVLERARRLNPPESLRQLIVDLASAPLQVGR